MEPMMPAVRGVLMDDNLLYMVFGELDWKRLLKAMRVCTMWRDLVRYSHKFQEKLFMEPRAGIKSPPSLSLDAQSRRALLHAFDVQPNTLLPELFPQWMSHLGYDQTIWGRYLHVTDVWAIRPKHRMLTLLRPEASWRNMMTHQPPIRHLSWRIVVYPAGPDPLEYYNLDFAFPRGLTMGALFDILRVAGQCMVAEGYILDKKSHCAKLPFPHACGPAPCAGLTRPARSRARMQESALRDVQLVLIQRYTTTSSNLLRLHASFCSQMMLAYATGWAWFLSVHGLFPGGVEVVAPFLTSAWHFKQSARGTSFRIGFKEGNFRTRR